jgi:hypothetical protein
MKRGKVTVLIVAVIGLLVFSSSGYSQIPRTISYQGYLTNASGVPVDGAVQMNFSIYNVPSGGGAIWSETQMSVPVINGIYNVILGSISPINLPFDVQYYLKVVIEGEEVLPRKVITSAGYAFRAYTVDVVPSHTHSGGDINSGIVAEPRIDALIARTSALTAHTSNTNNPHSTTAGQAGAAAAVHAHSGVDITSGTVAEPRIDAAIARTATLAAHASNTNNPHATTATQVGAVGLNQSNSISSAMIVDGTITAADLASSSVTKPKLSATGGTAGQVLGTDGTNLAWQGPSTGVGWVDDGGNVRLATAADKVGIGVATPGAKLEVSDLTRIQGSTWPSSGKGLELGYSSTLHKGYVQVYDRDISSWGDLYLGDGNVGIGVNPPQVKLDVRGQIRAKTGYGDSIQLGSSDILANDVEIRILAPLERNWITLWNEQVWTRANLIAGTIRMDGAGIGNTTPTEKLDVIGNLRVQDSGRTKSLMLRTSGGALDLDIHGQNLYVGGDSGNIMLIHNSRGNVGIGTTDPGQEFKLRVHSSDPNTSNYHPGAAYFTYTGMQDPEPSFALVAYNGFGVQAGGPAWDFYAAGYGTNYGPFTGGHEVKLSEDFPVDIKPGMIVSVTGKTLVRKRPDGTISLSSTLPTIRLSKVANDNTVFGVFVKEALPPTSHWYEKKKEDRFAIVNALGEGRVLVTNRNGNIEAGDYITTSNIPGYGQKQEDDILRSYTLGKAIETVDWDLVNETVVYNGQRVKVYLIAVAYTSG